VHVERLKNTSFYSKTLFCLCLVITMPVIIMAETTSEYFFNSGKRYYTNSDFESAVQAFRKAVESVPDSSVYHHWLGKSYGRLAESSGIFTAYTLSKKTREEFELAVKLDETNRDALADLIQYYQRAPSFLGGGQEKAKKLRLRLDALEKGNNSVSQP